MKQRHITLCLFVFFTLIWLSCPSIQPAVRGQAPEPETQPDCLPKKKKKVFLPLIGSALEISGKVTYQTLPVEGVFVALYDMKPTPERILVAQTNVKGKYTFTNIPEPGAGSAGYMVLFENGLNGNPDDSRYLAWWQSFLIKPSFSRSVGGGNFDIADVPLGNPAEAAIVSAPALFGWDLRGVAEDSYEFNLLSDAGGLVFATDLGYVGSYTLAPIPDEATPATRYWWYVWVRGPYGANGVSYGIKSVYFDDGPESSSMAPAELLRNWVLPLQ